MPKMKTKSGAKKRFKLKAGSVKVRRSNRNHLTAKKDSQTKRQRRAQGTLCKANDKKAREMIGDR